MTRSNKNLTLSVPVNVSVVEQMIPFHGTTILRQFVKGKPNPTGLKNFVLASPDGLVLDFVVYEGANTWPGGKPDERLGVGGTVVKILTERLQIGHTVFIDRYFTTLNLLEYLDGKGITAVGTILLNRLPKNVRAKLKSEKELQKEGRGAYQELVRDDEKVGLVKWLDNGSVLIATTKMMAAPIDEVRRYDKKTKKHIYLPRPRCIAAYNDSMGGVDLADRLVSYYRMGMRTRKWPVRFFFISSIWP